MKTSSRNGALRIALLSAVAAFAYAAEPAKTEPAKSAPAKSAAREVRGPRERLEFSPLERSAGLEVSKPKFNPDDIQGPVRGGDSPPVQGVDLPAPPTSLGTLSPADAKKLELLIDEKKNWIFSRPEDMGKEPTIEEVFGVSNFGQEEKAEKGRLERYLDEGPNREPISRDGKTEDRRDRKGDTAGDNEDEAASLGADFSLSALIEQQRALFNGGPVDAAGPNTGIAFFKPFEAALQNSAFGRNTSIDQEAALAAQTRAAELNKLFQPVTAGAAGSSRESSMEITRSVIDRSEQRMENLLESTRSQISAPFGSSRPSALDSIAGPSINSPASGSSLAEPAREFTRPAHTPATLPLPKRF